MHRELIDLWQYNTVLAGSRKHKICRGMVYEENTNTRISRTLEQIRSLLPIAERALRSSVWSVIEREPGQCRQRVGCTRQIPKSPHALVRLCDRKTPMQLSRPPEVLRLRDDVPRTGPQHRIQVGELLQRDEKGCLRPDALGQDQVQVGKVGSVKGGGYRTVGRKAVSNLCVDKAHIPRTDGRWTPCHWQSGGIHDVVPKRKKDIRWQDWDK